jgi:hypothetical protein
MGGKSMYLFTTTGRKRGQKRTTPVILVETDAGVLARLSIGPRRCGFTTCALNQRSTSDAAIAPTSSVPRRLS